MQHRLGDLLDGDVYLYRIGMQLLLPTNAHIMARFPVRVPGFTNFPLVWNGK